MDFFKRIFSGDNKRKEIPSDGHPYHVDSLPTGARLHYQEGLQHLNKRSYLEAEAEFTAATKIAPWHKLALYMLGISFIEQQKYVAAQRIIDELLQENPVDNFAMVLQATISHYQGDWEEAITLYRKAFYNRFPAAGPYVNYASLLVEINQDYVRAKSLLRIAKQVDSSLIQIYFLEIRIAQLENSPQDCLDSCNTALQYLPDNPDILAARGTHYFNQGEFALAEEDLLRALKAKSDNLIARTSYAFMLVAQSKFEDALDRLLSLYEEYPKDQLIAGRLSLTYINLRQYKNSIAISSELIQHFPQESIGFNNRGYAHYMLNKYDEALADLSEAIELSPNETLALINRINVYRFGLKGYEKALKDTDRLFELDEIKGRRIRGQIYFNMGRTDEAIQELNELLAINQDDPSAYNGRAWYKAYAGQLNEALQDAEKAIALDDSYSHFWGTRGSIKWLLEDYEAALIDFEKADEIIENGFVHKIEIAVAHMKLGKQDKAIETWKKSTSDKSKYQSANAYQEEFLFPLPFYEAMQELEALAIQSEG